MILRNFPPMGVYETLFRFAAATGKYMGDVGTHPWAQGFPLTTQLPGGPPLPASIALKSTDLKYPKATGEAPLLKPIRRDHEHFFATDGKGLQGYKKLQELLQLEQRQPEPVLREQRIRILAERLAALSDTKGKRQ